MTLGHRKTFRLSKEINEMIEKFARLPLYENDSRVARMAFAEFFENHKEELPQEKSHGN